MAESDARVSLAGCAASDKYCRLGGPGQHRRARGARQVDVGIDETSIRAAVQRHVHVGPHLDVAVPARVAPRPRDGGHSRRSCRAGSPSCWSGVGSARRADRRSTRRRSPGRAHETSPCRPSPSPSPATRSGSPAPFQATSSPASEGAQRNQRLQHQVQREARPCTGRSAAERRDAAPARPSGAATEPTTRPVGVEEDRRQTRSSATERCRSGRAALVSRWKTTHRRRRRRARVRRQRSSGTIARSNAHSRPAAGVRRPTALEPGARAAAASPLAREPDAQRLRVRGASRRSAWRRRRRSRRARAGRAAPRPSTPARDRAARAGRAPASSEPATRRAAAAPSSPPARSPDSSGSGSSSCRSGARR